MFPIKISGTQTAWRQSSSNPDDWDGIVRPVIKLESLATTEWKARGGWGWGVLGVGCQCFGVGITL